MRQTEEPPRGTERRAARTPSSGRRSQVRRRDAASTAAVVILLVFGVSLLVIVVAQAALGFDPFGLGSATANRPTVVVAGATPLPPAPPPALEVQPAEVALPDTGGRPFAVELALATLVQQQLGGQRATTGVALKNLDTGQGALVNADREFPAGGLAPLLVAYEAYHQRDTGRVAFSDPLTMTEAAVRQSAGTPEAPVGSTVSVGWAVDRLLTRGDPAMTALLLDRLGLLNFNNSLSDLGLQETRATAERITTSPRDLLLVLERLVRGQGLSAASAAELQQYLLDVRPGDRLVAALPRGTVVLQRAVSADRLAHEAAVLYTPAATIVFVALASDAANPNATLQAETALARAVYDYFNATTAGSVPTRSAYLAPTQGPRPTPPPARLQSGNLAPPPPTAPIFFVTPEFVAPQVLPTSPPLPTVILVPQPPPQPQPPPPAFQPTAVIPALRPTEPAVAPPFVTAVRPTAAPPLLAPPTAEVVAPPLVTAVRPTVAAAPPVAAPPPAPPVAVPTVSAPPPTAAARGPLPPTLGPAPAQPPAAQPPVAQPPPAQVPAQPPAAPAPTAPRAPDVPRFGQ